MSILVFQRFSLVAYVFFVCIAELSSQDRTFCCMRHTHSWVKSSSLGSARGRALSDACALAAVFFSFFLLVGLRCVCVCVSIILCCVIYGL